MLSIRVKNASISTHSVALSYGVPQYSSARAARVNHECPLSLAGFLKLFVFEDRRAIEGDLHCDAICNSRSVVISFVLARDVAQFPVVTRLSAVTPVSGTSHSFACSQ